MNVYDEMSPCNFSRTIVLFSAVEQGKSAALSERDKYIKKL